MAFFDMGVQSLQNRLQNQSLKRRYNPYYYTSFDLSDTDAACRMNKNSNFPAREFCIVNDLL